jgi:hypothetical protein
VISRVLSFVISQTLPLLDLNMLILQNSHRSLPPNDRSSKQSPVEIHA